MTRIRPVFHCKTCGQTFWRKRAKRDSRQYCSRECAFANWSEIRRTDRMRRGFGPALHRQHGPWPLCVDCGTEVGWQSRRCCPCRRAHDSERQCKYMRLANRRLYTVGRSCIDCGTYSGQSLFCSKRCRGRFSLYSHYWKHLDGSARQAMIAAVTRLKLVRRLLNSQNASGGHVGS